MTDRELNEAVAKKLGWGWYAREDIEGWFKEGELYLKDLPDYVHSIEAAWEIVDKIKETELFALCFHDLGWHCEINCCDGERPIDEEADTAPRAICEAFLKLKD